MNKLIENYFQSDALNISTLRLVFNPRVLKKKLDNRAIEEDQKRHYRIGDALDILLTQGAKEFNEHYLVAPKDRPSGMMGIFIDNLPITITEESPEEEYQNAYEISEYKQALSTTIASLWKNEKYKSYFEYRKKAESQGKFVLSHDEYEELVHAQKELLGNPFTRQYFMNNDPDIEIIYQLPIYFMVEEHEEGTEFEAKGLLDGVYIDHKKKTITPLDLKTIGKPISQFKQSYLKYGYYLQAEWYMYALEELIKFKNWKSIGEVVIPEKTFVGDKTHELNKKFSSLSDYRVNPFNFIVSETKPFYQNPAQIFKVPAEQRKFAWRGGTHNGRYYEGLNELLTTYKWHLETNYWDMPKELYLNQGITTLNLLT